MARPTIALCCIMKNEAHNISGFMQSVKGCFDEIHITDTGSTDTSVNFLEKINEHIRNKTDDWAGFPEIQIHHFKWVDDFAKARNYSFSHAKTDYICWFDLDDTLSDAQAFIHWRDHVLHSAHYWVALYNYSFGLDGKPECSFIRERVIKNNYGFKWEYFVHEGLIQTEGRNFWPQRVNTWWVNHRRTEEDRKNDHGRNLKLMEAHHYESLPPRMKFYYGKELMENGQHKEAGRPLMDAAKSDKLDIHDRILTIQYAAQSAYKCGAHDQAIDLAFNGLRLGPNRAEYWCLLGDAYVAKQQFDDAVLAYKTALTCQPQDMGGALVIYKHAYDEYPRLALAKLFCQLGNDKLAEEYVRWLEEKKHPESAQLRDAIEKVKDLSVVRQDLPKTTDVIITCPPGGVVQDWDENSHAVKGHGGSETAAIEVARWIKVKTGRKVKVFQQRQKREVMPSGVEYLPITELVGYLHNIEPACHIAWRHPVRLTHAPSYIWCHDLQCPGAAKTDNYDKIIALSGFHKQYLIETNGVPAEKIMLGFNGVNPDDFNVAHGPKDPLKVIFSSSPDRGLVQSIDIVKKARELSKMDIKLHCFYGTENMRKMGMVEWANSIEAKIKEHDFVVYHGMVPKRELMRHFLEASVWLYPADFIETYCITAIEAMGAGCWPIVRDMGALKYTMKEAIVKGCCDILQEEVKDEASTLIWAEKLKDAIEKKKFEKMRINPANYSWEKVADLFIKEFNL